MEKIIYEVFKNFSECHSRKGYPYLVKALCLACEEDHADVLKGAFYLELERRLGKRGIRRETGRVIHAMWRSNRELVEKLMGAKLDRKPRPLQFIHDAAGYLNRMRNAT